VNHGYSCRTISSSGAQAAKFSVLFILVPDDAKLLQAMLNELGNLSKGSMPDLTLPINGVYIDELCLWLRAFQESRDAFGTDGES
jgi:hypothetical protein